MWHVGSEQWLKVNGKAYRLARWTRRLVRAWYEWALSKIPNPLTTLSQSLHVLPSYLMLTLVNHADKLATERNNLEGEEFSRLWRSEEGLFKVFSLLIGEHHPELDEDEIKEVLSQVDLEALIARASGRLPIDEVELEKDYLRELGLMPAEASIPQPPVDWANIDRELFRNCYLTPQQVDEMTLPEIIVILGQKAEHVATDAESAIRFARLIRSLTPEQRLTLSLRRYPI